MINAKTLIANSFANLNAVFFINWSTKAVLSNNYDQVTIMNDCFLLYTDVTLHSS